MSTKTHISLTIAGDMSSGKSTLCGRLLYELGQIPPEELNKFMALQEGDQSSFFLRKEWRWLVEGEKNENISMRGVSCNFKTMETSTRKWVIIDCPGKYNKNITTGGLQGDVVVLAISAIESLLKSSLTFPHGSYIKMGGSVRDAWINQVHRGQLVVVVTMMDDERDNKIHFSEAQKLIIEALSKIGYQNPEKTVPIIPVSARDGKNISEISRRDPMSWWSGCTVVTPSGREVRVTTLLNALEDWVEVPYRKIHSGLRLPVFKHYPKKKTLVGSLLQGTLSVDDEVVFIPGKSEKPTLNKISSLQIFKGPIKRAEAGDCDLGIQLLDTSFVPKRGQIMVSPNDILVKYPCTDIVVTVHLIHSKIRLGSVPLLAVHTTMVPVRIKKFNWVILKSNKSKEINPYRLDDGNIASITVTPNAPVVVDRHEVSPKLGTVFFFQSTDLIMAGKVTDVIVGSGESLKRIELWSRIRLMFIGCYKDKGSSLTIVPKDIMRLICYYIWVLGEE